jgi:hypothetical protein
MTEEADVTFSYHQSCSLAASPTNLLSSLFTISFRLIHSLTICKEGKPKVMFCTAQSHTMVVRGIVARHIHNESVKNSVIQLPSQ